MAPDGVPPQGDLSAMPLGAAADRELLHDSPRVALHHNVLQMSQARQLIALASEKLGPALVSQADAGASSSARVAESAWIPRANNAAVTRIVSAICSLVGLPLQQTEMLHVVKYAAGGEYRAHFDAYDLTTARGQRCTERRGQRLATAIAYLNDDFEGGETYFPRLDIRIVPKAGALLVFDNVGDCLIKPDPRSLHAALPVTKGEKWIATSWFREK